MEARELSGIFAQSRKSRRKLSIVISIQFTDFQTNKYAKREDQFDLDF